MERKTNVRTPVECAPEIKDLLLDPGITRDVEATYSSYEKILRVVHLQSMGKEDKEALEIGRGLKELNRVLLLFRVEGAADREAEGRAASL